MIIEHLNNDGLDCRICNLYFLLKVKNSYKGNYYDKLSKESIPIVAMNIFHNVKNKTFQITIEFNESFVNYSNGESIKTLKLLYDADYWIVLQDAESILETIVQTKSVDMDELGAKYRFKDSRITLRPKLTLSEDEKDLKPGQCIMRDGKLYLIVGDDGKNVGRVTSVHYDESWQ